MFNSLGPGQPPNSRLAEEETATAVPLSGSASRSDLSFVPSNAVIGICKSLIAGGVAGGVIKYNVTVQGLKYNGKKKQPQGKKRWYFSSRKRRDSEQHGCLKVKRGGDLKKRRGLLSGLSLVTRTEKPSFVEDEGGIVLISNNLSSSSFSSRYGCYSLILF
ncbi:hypothetical protein Bca101_029894 [Brassica carinata]